MDGCRQPFWWEGVIQLQKETETEVWSSPSVLCSLFGPIVQNRSVYVTHSQIISRRSARRLNDLYINCLCCSSLIKTCRETSTGWKDSGGTWDDHHRTHNLMLLKLLLSNIEKKLFSVIHQNWSVNQFMIFFHMMMFYCHVLCLPGNPQELSGVLRYHLGEGMLVSGGVSSHTRIKPLQGEKLELGVVSPLSSPVV